MPNQITRSRTESARTRARSSSSSLAAAQQLSSDHARDLQPFSHAPWHRAHTATDRPSGRQMIVLAHATRTQHRRANNPRENWFSRAGHTRILALLSTRARCIYTRHTHTNTHSPHIHIRTNCRSDIALHKFSDNTLPLPLPSTTQPHPGPPLRFAATEAAAAAAPSVSTL